MFAFIPLLYAPSQHSKQIIHSWLFVEVTQGSSPTGAPPRLALSVMTSDLRCLILYMKIEMVACVCFRRFTRVAVVRRSRIGLRPTSDAPFDGRVQLLWTPLATSVEADHVPSR